MIRYVRGDIFKSRAQTLVNPVNTVGVMGAGLAREFSRHYPGILNRYKEFCRQGVLKIGTLWVYRSAWDRWVLCFPTKKDWREPSKLEYIEAGLKKLVDTYEARGITDIAIPKLGCGLGGLSWGDVRPLMEKHLSGAGMDIEIYVAGPAESLKTEACPW